MIRIHFGLLFRSGRFENHLWSDFFVDTPCTPEPDYAENMECCLTHYLDHLLRLCMQLTSMLVATVHILHARLQIRGTQPFASRRRCGHGTHACWCYVPAGPCNVMLPPAAPLRRGGVVPGVGNAVHGDLWCAAWTAQSGCW